MNVSLFRHAFVLILLSLIGGFFIPSMAIPRLGSFVSSKARRSSNRDTTFGFSDVAKLDDGALWPTSFALKELTPAEEVRIGALVKKAVS